MMMPSIKILMITHNRPRYTRLSLERLSATVPQNAKIVIWDNASDSETRDVVSSFAEAAMVEEIVFNARNDRLRGPTNWFFEKYGSADLLSKVDDDCLVPERWCETLSSLHSDIAEAGVVGCWRFFPEDFIPGAAEKKIQKFGAHRVMRNCWVEGSGFLMKRAVLERNGLLKEGETFTSYCIRAAKSGFVNGWYYPFLFQEHMDDPRSEHSMIKTDEAFLKNRPLSAETFGIGSVRDWTERLKRSSRLLQEYSFDYKDHIGLKAKIKKKAYGLIGLEYVPKA